MKLLGIDPGLATVGFGMVEASPSGTFTVAEWGTITTSKHKQEAARLQEIREDLTQLIIAHKPDVMAIERLFFFKNAKTMVPVCQARGVILLVSSELGLPVFEYTPMQVKQALTGYGKASKKDIQLVMAQILGLSDIPRPDDAADALALSVCHFNSTARFDTSSRV